MGHVLHNRVEKLEGRAYMSHTELKFTKENRRIGKNKTSTQSRPKSYFLHQKWVHEILLADNTWFAALDILYTYIRIIDFDLFMSILLTYRYATSASNQHMPH
jgi:hypothetical protein